MRNRPVNLQASVAARLRNIARDKKADFELDTLLGLAPNLSSAPSISSRASGSRA
jgi:hypothetical protein